MILVLLIVTTLEILKHIVFQLVYRLIVLALTLPIETATVERAFSATKFVKTKLRSNMGGDWLNHRMICYIERDVFAKIKYEDILYHFQVLKSRMKKLPPLPQTRASGMLY